jgi:dTDP-glucose 4,6-dehydratase
MVQAYYKSFKVPIIITRSNNVYGPFQYPEKIFPKFIMHLLYPNSLTSTSGSGPGSPKKNDNDISGGHCYIHGSGQHSRTYLYVADAANALDVILHRGLVGEVYNIGAGHELSNIELAQNLIHRLVEPLPAKSLHLKNGRETGRGGRGLNGYVREPEWSVIKRQEKACQHQGECQTCIDRIVFVEDRAFNDQRYAVDSTKLVGLGWSPSVDYEQGIVNTSKSWSTVVNGLLCVCCCGFFEVAC